MPVHRWSRRSTTFGSSGSRRQAQCPTEGKHTAARVQDCNSGDRHSQQLLWILHGSGALPNQGHPQATAVNNRQRTWSQSTGGFSTKHTKHLHATMAATAATHRLKLKSPTYDGNYAAYEEWTYKFTAYMGLQDPFYPRMFKAGRSSGTTSNRGTSTTSSYNTGRSRCMGPTRSKPEVPKPPRERQAPPAGTRWSWQHHQRPPWQHGFTTRLNTMRSHATGLNWFWWVGGSTPFTRCNASQRDSSTCLAVGTRTHKCNWKLAGSSTCCQLRRQHRRSGTFSTVQGWTWVEQWVCSTHEAQDGRGPSTCPSTSSRLSRQVPTSAMACNTPVLAILRIAVPGRNAISNSCADEATSWPPTSPDGWWNWPDTGQGPGLQRPETTERIRGSKGTTTWADAADIGCTTTRSRTIIVATWTPTMRPTAMKVNMESTMADPTLDQQPGWNCNTLGLMES